MQLSMDAVKGLLFDKRYVVSYAMTTYIYDNR